MMTVPQGWEVKRLGDLANIVGGGTPARDIEEYWKNGDILWATPTDITKEKTGKYIDQTEEYITEKGLSSSSAKLIPVNSILLTSRANIGDMRLNTKPMATNQGFASLIPYDDNAQFLYYLLGIYVPYMRRRAYGTTFPEISKTEVKNIPVVIPKNLVEQQKIASILSGIDCAIEATQTLIDKEKMIKKALMADLLNHGIDEQGRIRTPQTHCYVESSLGMIPSGWEVKRLGEIGECINGLTYSPDDVVEYDGILVLRSSNIQGNKLAFEDNVYVRSDMRITDRTRVNDILICVRNGSKSLIGKNALITGEAHDQAHGAFMTVFRTQHYKYIFQLFQSDMYTTQVEKNLGATINSINNSDLLMFEFPLPMSLDEQLKIAQILSAQDHKIETEEANLAKLQNLKKALMADLLSGKVRVMG